SEQRRSRDRREAQRLPRCRRQGSVARRRSRRHPVFRSVGREGAQRLPDFPSASSTDPPQAVKRENVIGRANVEDTPELEAYYRSLEGEALGALWTVANEIEPWYPQPKSVPTLWKWRTVEPYVRKAAELVS